jgi:hypothetical protein
MKNGCVDLVTYGFDELVNIGRDSVWVNRKSSQSKLLVVVRVLEVEEITNGEQ